MLSRQLDCGTTRLRGDSWVIERTTTRRSVLKQSSLKPRSRRRSRMPSTQILMRRCREQGVDLKGPDAPTSVRKAVARFFEVNPDASYSGALEIWD